MVSKKEVWANRFLFIFNLFYRKSRKCQTLFPSSSIIFSLLDILHVNNILMGDGILKIRAGGRLPEREDGIPFCSMLSQLVGLFPSPSQSVPHLNHNIRYLRIYIVKSHNFIVYMFLSLAATQSCCMMFCLMPQLYLVTYLKS